MELSSLSYFLAYHRTFGIFLIRAWYIGAGSGGFYL